MPGLGYVVARNIRAERTRRRWKHRDLAERLGWDPDDVIRAESGQRRLSTEDLPALCAAFEIPLTQLLTGAEADDLRALGLSPEVGGEF